jgi:hypothetical protein
MQTVVVSDMLLSSFFIPERSASVSDPPVAGRQSPEPDGGNGAGRPRPGPDAGRRSRSRRPVAGRRSRIPSPFL